MPFSGVGSQDQSVAELVMRILAETAEFTKEVNKAKKTAKDFIKGTEKDAGKMSISVTESFRKIIIVVNKITFSLKSLSNSLRIVALRFLGLPLKALAVFATALITVRRENERVMEVFESYSKSLIKLANVIATAILPVVEKLADYFERLVDWFAESNTGVKSFVLSLIFLKTILQSVFGILTSFAAGLTFIFGKVFMFVVKAAILIWLTWLSKLIFGMGLFSLFINVIMKVGFAILWLANTIITGQFIGALTVLSKWLKVITAQMRVFIATMFAGAGGTKVGIMFAKLATSIKAAYIAMVPLGKETGKFFVIFSKAIKRTFSALLSTTVKLGPMLLSLIANLGKRLLWIARVVLMSVLRNAILAIWYVLLPFTVLLAKLAAVVVVLYTAWRKNWFKIRDVTLFVIALSIKAWKNMKESFFLTLTLIQTAWKKAWEKMREPLRLFWEEAKKTTMSYMNFLEKGWFNLIDAMALMLELFGQIQHNVWKNMGSAARTVLGWLGTFFSATFKSLGTTFGWFADMWAGTWKILSDIVETAFGWVGKLIDKTTGFFVKMMKFKEFREQGEYIRDAWRMAGIASKKAMEDMAKSGKDTETKLRNLAKESAAFVKGYTDKITDIGKTAESFWEKAGVDTKKYLTDLGGYVQQYTDFIANDIKAAHEKWADYVRTGGREALEGFKQALKDMVESGKILLNGLVVAWDNFFNEERLTRWQKFLKTDLVKDFFAGWKKGIDSATKGWDNWKTHIQNTAEAIANGLQNTFSSFFVDAFNGQLKTATEYFMQFRNAVIQAIAQMISKMLAFMVLKNSLGKMSVFKGAFSALFGATKHLGGMIKMAHEGLSVGEVPIIAQEGEAVLSRQGVAGIGGASAVDAVNAGGGLGGGTVNKTVNIYAMDSDSFEEYTKKNKNSIGEAAMDSADENGPIRRS